MPDMITCREVNVNWHPHMGDGTLAPDVSLPTVSGRLTPTNDVPLTLFLLGLGEGRASAEAAVDCWEQEYGLPAAGAWLSYHALPVTEANLVRIAVEAPLAIAEHYAGKRPVHLVTNSLGCLGVNAAAEAPERFSHIASLAPYALANEYRGHLPLVGAPFVARAAVMGINLGVRTVAQHWSDRRDPDMKAVVRTALTDTTRFGFGGGKTAVDTALSAKIGRRTADSYIRLAANGHGEYLAAGNRDYLVNVRHIHTALGAAATRLGVDTSDLAVAVHELKGPHSPFCSRRGLEQLTYIANWLALCTLPLLRPTPTLRINHSLGM